ncbi:MAG TPA: ABC transporter permease [Puia sp.]|nr:ABC transporter permease [Puia sp.]
MLRSYLKIAFRNLTRNKVFSFINIFGLAAGMATCLLIMLYILDESSYDKNHKDGERIYRVASTVAQIKEDWAAGPAPMAWAMKNELPEVEQVTRLLTFPDVKKMLLRYEHGTEKKQFVEPNGYYADSTFFQLFTYDFINGNGRTALDQPNSMVISDELARKFFGNEDPVGKILTVGNSAVSESNYTVKGVFAGNRNKSHIPAAFFLSMRNDNMGKWVEAQHNWATNNIFFTYIKLRPGTRREVFEPKFRAYFDEKAASDLKALGISKTVYLQPLKDIYLHSAIANEIAANGNITYLYILGSIAAFILLIACINFMNLSTARSEKRAKEVGVRKVLGAEKQALVRQFLGESFFMCLIALALALLMAWMLLPVFNSLTLKNLQPFDQPGLIGWIIGLTLLTGLLAGLYPALYLSAFKPIRVLKGKIINSFSAVAIRKGLVVFQFTISVCLVLGAIVIWQQLNFLKKQDLGFDKSRQIILPLQNANTGSNYTALRHELEKIPQIKMVSSGSSYPGIPNIEDMLFYPGGKPKGETTDIGLSAIEADYIQTLGFKLLSGRAFGKEYTADSASIVLNESAVRALGFTPGDAIGKKIDYDFQGAHKDMLIVGVVKDFNFESLHNPIKPFGFVTGFFGNKYSFVIASLNSDDYPRLLAGIEKIWSKLIPGAPFAYSFLDQDFQRNYEKEERTSGIVAYFTFIAILIACLGLFGLAAFSAEQRTKEIGIRKVLGASILDVAALLSRDFIRLVLVAIVIAVPLGWFAINKWLQSFAYRVPVGWPIFLLAAGAAIFVALITITFQAVRAGMSNPAKSLRSE